MSCCLTLCLKRPISDILLYFICPKYSGEATLVEQSDPGLQSFQLSGLNSVVPDQTVFLIIRT